MASCSAVRGDGRHARIAGPNHLAVAMPVCVDFCRLRGHGADALSHGWRQHGVDAVLPAHNGSAGRHRWRRSSSSSRLRSEACGRDHRLGGADDRDARASSRDRGRSGRIDVDPANCRPLTLLDRHVASTGSDLRRLSKSFSSQSPRAACLVDDSGYVNFATRSGET